MSELNTIILTKVEKIESDISDIKVATVENTSDLKHHIKRTNDLQEIVEDLHTIVTPLHEKFVSEKAIEEFKKKQEELKKQQKEDLIFKLKLPGYIVAALVAIGTLLTWITRK